MLFDHGDKLLTDGDEAAGVQQFLRIGDDTVGEGCQLPSVLFQNGPACIS